MLLNLLPRACVESGIQAQRTKDDMSFMIMTHAAKPVEQREQNERDVKPNEGTPIAYRRPYSSIWLALHHLFPRFGQR